MAESGLRVGIIGAGWVASTRHIPSFRSVPGVELVGILDRNPARARMVAESHKIALASDDRADFYRAEPDIVAICTPPQTHASVAIDALERGCHVFIEKPMAINEAEARDMIEAANRNNRLLCVSHNLLFSRSIQKVNE